MDISGDPAAGLRIGDEERARAVSRLGEHWGAGRLHLVEFEERTTAALSARTSDDLAALFHDLPGGLPGAPGGGRPTRSRLARARGRTPALATAGVGLVLGLAAVVQPYRVQELVDRVQALL